jgi:hypothetical protein
MPKINSTLIIDEIEKRNVVPIPRWHFLLKRAAFWLLAAVAVITGALAMATAIYVFIDNDYITDRPGIDKLFAERPLIEIVVQSIPYIWLVALALFVIVAYYGVRHTRKGYRYSALRVITVTVSLSFLISVLLNTFDIGRFIHRYLIENVKGYGRLVYTNEVLWAQMERGLLGGKIIRYSARDSLIVIRDYHGHHWQVDLSGVQAHPDTHIIVGKYLKITGFKTGAGTFRALTIRPWMKKPRKQSTSEKKHASIILKPRDATLSVPARP